MQWHVLFTSLEPKRYGVVREISLVRMVLLVGLVAVAGVALFTLLLVPAVFQSDTLARELSKTTSITLDGSLQQTAPTFLSRNPDVLITTEPVDENAFITVTQESVSIKYFIFFGERTYPWILFSDVTSAPVQSILVPLMFFLVPSIIVWGSLVAVLQVALGAMAFTGIAGVYLHVRGYVVRLDEISKVSLLASVPSIAIGALTPILRLGLPLALIAGLMLVLWLVLALLGTSQLVERRAAVKYRAKH